MKINTMFFNAGRGLLATALVTLLVACGGGGSSSDDSSSSESVVSRGVITQLGSIWVNGVEYETPNGGRYSNDDSTSSVANYQVGQVVSVRGRRNDDGVSGTADEVEYEAEIEGAADASGKILGITILQTPKTNAPGIPATLANGTRYEVSGIWIDDTTIEATFIKIDDDGDGVDEIKGFVDSVGASSFQVRGITYNGYTGVPALTNGDFVEVHFNPASCSVPPNVTCTMTSVELEDDFFDRAEGLEVEVEGAVDLSTAGCPAQANFKVDGVCIDSTSKPAQWLDGLTEFADLAQGSRVEAEGHMIGTPPNHYLRADKVKGRGNRVRVSSIAGNVNTGAGSFTLVEGNITVSTVPGTTQFEDGLTINNIANEIVEVRGVRTGSSEMLAIRVKSTGLSGGGDRHELRAEVDLNGADSGAGRVTVMNIVSQGNGGTELEVDDTQFGGSLTQFLNLVDDNDNPADGSRDIIEIGFDIGSGDGSSGSPYTAEEIEIEEEDD